MPAKFLKSNLKSSFELLKALVHKNTVHKRNTRPFNLTGIKLSVSYVTFVSSMWRKISGEKFFKILYLIKQMSRTEIISYTIYKKKNKNKYRVNKSFRYFPLQYFSYKSSSFFNNFISFKLSYMIGWNLY